MRHDHPSFEEYCDQHEIAPEERPAAFAAYLHEISGGTWDGEMKETDGD